MNLITKVLSVGSAIGIVGGAVAITNHLYKGFKNIEQRLSGFGYRVLKFNDSDKDEWTKVDAAYNSEKDTNKKFKGEAKDLKEHCSIALANPPNDEDIYKLTRKWCVKEENVKSMLTKNKYTQLEKTATKQEERTKWESKVNELRRISQGTEKIVIDFTKGDMNAWIKSLEDECEKLINEDIKNHKDDEFEIKYMKAKNWCSLKENGTKN